MTKESVKIQFELSCFCICLSIRFCSYMLCVISVGERPVMPLVQWQPLSVESC